MPNLSYFSCYLQVTSGYLVVTSDYLVVTSGYLIVTTGCFSLLLDASRFFCFLVLVTTNQKLKQKHTLQKIYTEW